MNLAVINGKPLIAEVTDILASIVDQTLVIADSDESARKYLKVVNAKVSFVVHDERSPSELKAALTGFSKASGKYSLLISSDAPFISKDVLLLLFELCTNRNAAVPRYPDQRIEALHAVYCTKAALETAESGCSEGREDLPSLVERMQGVRYVSTLVIEQLDPGLRSFSRVRTPLDLKRVSAKSNSRKKK